LFCISYVEAEAQCVYYYNNNYYYYYYYYYYSYYSVCNTGASTVVWRSICGKSIGGGG